MDPFQGTYQAAPRYFSEAVEACLAVFHRLGSDCPAEVYPVSLRRELREKGLDLEEGQHFASLCDRAGTAISPGPGGRRFLPGETAFDLVIESVFPIAIGCDEASRFRFENCLRRRGIPAGLMVDFRKRDFITEGFRLVRVKPAASPLLVTGRN